MYDDAVLAVDEPHQLIHAVPVEVRNERARRERRPWATPGETRTATSRDRSAAAARPPRRVAVATMHGCEDECGQSRRERPRRRGEESSAGTERRGHDSRCPPGDRVGHRPGERSIGPLGPTRAPDLLPLSLQRLQRLEVREVRVVDDVRLGVPPARRRPPSRGPRSGGTRTTGVPSRTRAPSPRTGGEGPSPCRSSRPCRLPSGTRAASRRRGGARRRRGGPGSAGSASP